MTVTTTTAADAKLREPPTPQRQRPADIAPLTAQPSSRLNSTASESSSPVSVAAEETQVLEDALLASSCAPLVFLALQGAVAPALRTGPTPSTSRQAASASRLPLNPTSVVLSVGNSNRHPPVSAAAPVLGNRERVSKVWQHGIRPRNHRLRVPTNDSGSLTARPSHSDLSRRAGSSDGAPSPPSDVRGSPVCRSPGRQTRVESPARPLPLPTSTAATPISIPSTATSKLSTTSPSTPAPSSAPPPTSIATSAFRLKAASSPTAPTTASSPRRPAPSSAIRRTASFPSPTPSVGGAKVGGPVFQPCTWGWGVTAGVGVDYILPAFNNHLAIRPIQADFDYSHVDYGPARPAR